MGRLIICIVALFTASCFGKPEIDFCKPVVFHKRYEVPVYVNPFDNVTLSDPEVYAFVFTDNGTITMDEENFKKMLATLINYKKYVKACGAIINENGD